MQVLDPGSNSIRALAGSGKPGLADGAGAAAQLSEPGGLCLGPGGTVFVADTNNSLVRCCCRKPCCTRPYYRFTCSHAAQHAHEKTRMPSVQQLTGFKCFFLALSYHMTHQYSSLDDVSPNGLGHDILVACSLAVASQLVSRCVS